MLSDSNNVLDGGFTISSNQPAHCDDFRLLMNAPASCNTLWSDLSADELGNVLHMLWLQELAPMLKYVDEQVSGSLSKFISVAEQMLRCAWSNILEKPKGGDVR